MKIYIFDTASESARETDLYAVQVDAAQEAEILKLDKYGTDPTYSAEESQLSFDPADLPMVNFPCHIDGAVRYWYD